MNYDIIKEIEKDYNDLIELSKNDPALNMAIFQMNRHGYSKEFVFQKLIIHLISENKLLKEKLLNCYETSSFPPVFISKGTIKENV